MSLTKCAAVLLCLTSTLGCALAQDSSTSMPRPTPTTTTGTMDISTTDDALTTSTTMAPSSGPTNPAMTNSDSTPPVTVTLSTTTSNSGNPPSSEPPTDTTAPVTTAMDPSVTTSNVTTVDVTTTDVTTPNDTSDPGSGDSTIGTTILMPSSTSETMNMPSSGPNTPEVMNEPSSSSTPDSTSPMVPATISSTTLVTTTSSASAAALWEWVGVAAAVMAVLIVVVGVLSVCVLYRLCGGHKGLSPLRKISSSSNKKLIECALEEITDHKENGSLEHLFDHLTAAQLSSFPASSLQSHVEQLHDEDSYLAEEEYEEVRKLDPPASCNQAKLSCNELRNRYTNILPRDSTRVVLSTIPKVAGSDYINANFVDGFTHTREYIATQGPLPSTCPDFWRMIWEYNVHVIVMVTNLEENGMLKCHQYWPSVGVAQYGTMSVSLESQVLYPEFIVRKFTLTMVSKSKKLSQVGVAKTVTQYHFTAWPDFGVPKEASAMIKFVRRVRCAVSPAHGPVVTHCSAGVGRTGTYIAVDILTQKLDKGLEVNVQEVVCRMRTQRGLMVQTPAQYMFIYDSVLYYHQFGHMEVAADALGAYIEGMDMPTEDGDTPLDKEFQHVINMRMSHDSLYSVALDDENSEKNRDSNNIPLDNNRVVLEDSSSDEGYINASFITGYYNRIEFIATQHPLPSTTPDFWAMIWQRNVKTIVTIGPLADPQDCYWPTLTSEPKKFDDGIIVSLVESEWVEEAGLTRREMNVHSIENTEEPLPVTQFHLQSWPEGGVPNETTPITELIEQSREHWRESGFNLIAVHTASGVGQEAAGVYCGLCVLFRQLDVEDFVDIFAAVRKLRKQRPAILTSKDYYRFMYRVLDSQQKEQ